MNYLLMFAPCLAYELLTSPALVPYTWTHLSSSLLCNVRGSSNQLRKEPSCVMDLRKCLIDIYTLHWEARGFMVCYKCNMLYLRRIHAPSLQLLGLPWWSRLLVARPYVQHSSELTKSSCFGNELSHVRCGRERTVRHADGGSSLRYVVYN